MNVLSLPIAAKGPASGTESTVGGVGKNRTASETALNITHVFARQVAPAVMVVTLLIGCRKPSSTYTSDARPVGPDAGRPADDPRPLAAPPCPAGPRVTASQPGQQTLKVQIPADPVSLDPFDEGAEVGLRVLRDLVVEPLVSCPTRGKEAGDGDGVAPGVASAWQIAPDADSITFFLRAGATFHDGRLVGSADVRASLEAATSGASRMPIARASLADLQGIDIVSPSAVRLRLRRPSRLFLRALCEIPIVPASWLSGKRSGPAAQSPMGTGPYRFVDWTKGRSLRLARASRPGLPPAPFAEIVFAIEPSTGQALGQLRLGALDVIPELHPVHFPAQVRPAALGHQLQLISFPTERESYLAVNHGHALLGQLAVRRALSALWDRSAIAEELHHGLAVPIGAPRFAPDVPAPVFDPAAAARWLREAGVIGEPSAKRRLAPIRHRLGLLHGGGKLAMAELRPFVERLRRLGIFVELVEVPAAELAVRLRSGTFDLALVAFEGRPHEDPRIRFGARGLLNHGNFHSLTVETLLDELRVNDSAAGRRSLDHRLGALLAEELPVIFLYRHIGMALVNERLADPCHAGGRLGLAHLAPRPGQETVP